METETLVQEESDDGSECPPETQFKVPSLINIPLKKKTNVADTNVFSEDQPDQATDKKSDTEDADEAVDNSVKTSSENSSESKAVPYFPAEMLQQSTLSASIPYKEPEWGGIGEDAGKYKLEVIKQGIVVEEISLAGKSYFVFGRLPSCDHPMDHPSISRHHALLQYRSLNPKNDQTMDVESDTKTETDSTNPADSKALVGWYLYDLDSTHGTWVNKIKIQPQVFVRVRTGYVIKFGGSTRLFIIQGPSEDCDTESELSVTEIQKLRRETEMARKMKQMAEKQELEMQSAMDTLTTKKNDFCTWGLEDEAVDDNPEDENPFAEPELTDESLYLDDPKKSIKGFFEREGLDLPEYEFIEDNTSFSAGSCKKCRLELPIDSPNGQPVYAEVSVTGRQKEAVVACALEACRMLDRMGLLRQAKHESRKRKRKDWAENDYYDSDDDTYLDRTGDVERKREKRMKKAMPKKAETYESLVVQLEDVVKEIDEIKETLAKDDDLTRKAKAAVRVNDEEEGDALDVFMKTIKLGGLGTKAKMTMKARLIELNYTRKKFESLVTISKPCEVKVAKGQTRDAENKASVSSAFFGKKMKFSKFPLAKSEPKVKVEPPDNCEEEMDEDNETNPLPQTTPASQNLVKTKTPEHTVKEDTTESSPKTIKATPNVQLDVDDSPAKVVTKRVFPPDDEDPSKKFTKLKEEPITFKLFSKRRDLSETTIIKKKPDAESTWMPPEDQIGDGRTKLNEKFGY